MWSQLLHDMETALARSLSGDAKAAGLQASEARLLLSLEPDRGLSMREVADRLARDPTTATRFVDRAEKRDLVERHAGRQDRRQRMVFLGVRGRACREALLLRRHQRANAMVQVVQQTTGLGENQIGWFLNALRDALRDARRDETRDAPRGSASV